MVKHALKEDHKEVTIGVVAKYLDNEDTYMSVFEALYAAGWWNDTKVNIKWVNAEHFKTSQDAEKAFEDVDGIVVPGGFGTRGVEGKIIAAQHALKHNLPYLGLCLGLKVAVVAAARSGGLNTATSEELQADAREKVI